MIQCVKTKDLIPFAINFVGHPGHANLPIGPEKAVRLSETEKRTNTKYSLALAFKEGWIWV